MSATCVGIRAPLALRARANGGVKGSRTVRVLAKASVAEDGKGGKVGKFFDFGFQEFHQVVGFLLSCQPGFRDFVHFFNQEQLREELSVN